MSMVCRSFVNMSMASLKTLLVINISAILCQSPQFLSIKSGIQNWNDTI
jgi:hypothetical protein